MASILIKNGQVVNRGRIKTQDIYIRNGFIEKIDNDISRLADKVIDAENKFVIPGIIDDQVHFREPGLTHKANIHSEARAAVAGGVTSFMEMPNVNPTTTTQALLAEKYAIGAAMSLANYSFFMGATNENLDEVLRTNGKNVCGIKVFMGSSTGNMLVDDAQTLEKLFSECPLLIATHCEDEATIRQNLLTFSTDNVSAHPFIRSREACYKSSSLAVKLAQKHNTRLHILHISTAEELALFSNELPLEQKRITAEVCVHHLFFNDSDYLKLGNLIKCNPAIKRESDQKALLSALLSNKLDIIATDHAPHTSEEKAQPYATAPSGLPLVQHALPMMLRFYHEGKISLERIVEKMSHAPATCFKIDKRGFLEEGYWADIAILDANKSFTVNKENILFKCGWSPLEGYTLKGVVEATLVSGHLAYQNGQFFEEKKGERLTFLN
jgi:dihydroorotase